MSAAARKPVLIVGAGIAGLSLATALRRNGWPVDMVEINPAWNVYGVGIILQANALRALSQLGLSDACIAAGFPYSLSRHHEEDGTPRADRIKPTLSDEGLPPSCGILRPALHEVLRAAALGAGARVRLGLTVQTLDQGDTGVDVAFSDGSRRHYGLVVGADGIRSAIRSLVFSESAQPQFTGQGCWRYTLPRPPDVTSALMYHGQHARLAGLVPVSPDQMYLLLLSMEPGNPRLSEAELPRLMAQRLQSFGGRIPQAMQHIPAPEHIVYRPLETLLVQPPWHRGHVVLMGDAAHATTPHMAQGASMALEDALVLNECLQSSGPLQQALAAYSARRFARCKRVVDASVQVGRWQMHPEPGVDMVGHLRDVAEELMRPA